MPIRRRLTSKWKVDTNAANRMWVNPGRIATTTRAALSWPLRPTVGLVATKTKKEEVEKQSNEESESNGIFRAMSEGDGGSTTAPPTVNQPVATKGEPAVRFVDPVDKYAALVVRSTIVGMGLIGVGLFLRNSRLFARFEHVAQIPKEFIQKELELKGTVREIMPSGELRVEHVPIVRLPSIFSPRKQSKGLLNLRFASDKQANHFTVIKPSDDSVDSVDADVTVKKNAFNRLNLNVEVVRRGYARVPPPESLRHLKALQSIPAYSRLINRLLMSEKIADRRGVGLWERDSWVESVRSYPSQFRQIILGAPITKFLILVLTVSKDVLLYGVKLTQQTYAILLVACSHIADGYKRFASGVDRLTDKYNKVRQRFK
ncbi:hypothetical protein KIN20_030216 [Parelaphostrongylus tenuis]|uniref:Uncharacterized protein n=1 Tax=Parelaphostrongylus tenuis TaxID=148309 RepID=A0AAD5R3K4_PARTN|nr:hypothetical protein KIN20_030216 [Parelaphostrongylus tenuis]